MDKAAFSIVHINGNKGKTGFPFITQPAASNDRLGYFLISEKIHQNEKDETTPSVICMQQDRDTEESKQREKMHPRCFPEVFKSTEGKISKKESKKNILFISIMPGVCKHKIPRNFGN